MNVQMIALASDYLFLTQNFCPQKYMPRKKVSEELQSTYVECLLYAFHELAHKVTL